MATDALVRLLLYGTGPFVSNPVKALLNGVAGAPYITACAYFR